MKRISLFLIILSISAGICSATYLQWDGGARTTDWNNAVNWNTDKIPGTSDKAGFKTATGAVVTTTVPTFMQMTLGGPGGLGVLTVQSGAIINCTDTWSMGQSSDETGTLNVTGGSITISNWLYAGNAGKGTINMTDGSITVVGLFSIANASSSTGTVNLDGGTITASSTFNMAPSGGTARLNITGGKLIINGNVTSTINTYVNSNHWITGFGSTANVHWDFNSTSNKTTVWAANATKATNPSPANNAIDISKNPTLSWTAASGTDSHNIYFGTESTGILQTNQTATAFNPGPLQLDTTYYWRIDEVIGPNTVIGDVWSFKTVSGQAMNPEPNNNTVNVAFDKILRWTPGACAASHNIYFGTDLDEVDNAYRLAGDLNGDNIVDWDDISLLMEYWMTDPEGSQPYAEVYIDNIVDFIDYALLAQDWMNANPVFKGNQDTNSYNPGTLEFDTIYYWRVDEVNGPDTIRGNVWSFGTLSNRAFNPGPVSGSSNVPLNSVLNWSAGPAAISHNVYFGTADPPAFRTNAPDTNFNPGVLVSGVTYYWRIDEVSGAGAVTGDVWNFTTVPLGTTPVYSYLTWRHNPTDSVVVNWLNTVSQGDSTVDYGTTSTYDFSVNVPTITNCHHAEITGLNAGATYHYRVRSNDGTVGADNIYKVPAASITSFSFAVYGDPRGASGKNEPYYTRHQALCDWILANNFDFSLEMGDVVWAGSTGLNVYWPDFYRLESNFTRSKIIMSTLGNHEVQDADNYSNYQSLYNDAFPTNGVSGNNGRVYSFDYGNAHFVCLSSYQMNLSQQAAWLATDLAAARANPNIKWIFAYMHAPMYTTNTSRGNRTDCIAAWGPIFDTYHVDVVFSGHNHLYERSKSIKAGAAVADGIGTVYVTTGLGGASFDPPGSGSPGLFVLTYNLQTLATCVVINGNNLTVNAITNTDNFIRDTFTLSK